MLDQAYHKPGTYALKNKYSKEIISRQTILLLFNDALASSQNVVQVCLVFVDFDVRNLDCIPFLGSCCSKHFG